MKKAIIQFAFLLLACTITKAQDFTSLFNGKNLDGWYSYIRNTIDMDTANVFTVKDNLLQVSGKYFRYIATKKWYKNFHLSLEFKWGVSKHAPRQNTKRDSGILYYFSSVSTRIWIQPYIFFIGANS